MRKVLLIFAIGLLIISCGDRNKGNEETLSGLTPSKFEFRTETGKLNKLYVLKNAAGMEVTVTNMGARIVSVVVPDKDGNMVNVVAGYDAIQPYQQLTDYTGAVLGRYAGRMSSEVHLDRVTYRLRTNEGNIALNGGPRGFSTQYFNIEVVSENSVICSYLSKDTEEGFPGNLDFTVTYTVTDNNALSITYDAFVSRTTYINVTNQLHFNLSGVNSNTIAGQELFVDAASYVELAENKLPTGKFLPVSGNTDFTALKPIDGDALYDVMYVLNNPGEKDNLAARMVSNTTGINLEVYTTEPGIQLDVTPGKPVIILQTQHFPDSPHQPDFPSTTLRADESFTSSTVYKFGIQK